MTRYRWEPTHGIAGRYRDTTTGRYVPAATVRRELDRYLDNHADAGRVLSGMIRNRQIGLADWELAMRRQIKNVHLNAVALERGGFANLTPRDYGRVGAAVRVQYSYLSNFALEIADGYQRLDGTLDWRVNLYMQSGRSTYYASHAANMSAEVTHHGSVLGKRDSCWQCRDLHGRIFALNDSSFVLPGRRVCNANCGCNMRYYRQKPDGGHEVLETA